MMEPTIEHRIRAAAPEDVERIKSIAVAAEMFTEIEVEFFDEMLGGFFDGSMGGHRWLVAEGVDVLEVAGRLERA